MAKTVEITEEEYQVFKGMEARMKRMEESLMRGVGVDPAIAARNALPFVKVQFSRHYNRAAQPSEIQKGALIIPGYSVTAGDIIRIRRDEYERLHEEFPDLVEGDRGKWVPKLIHTWKQEPNKSNGRMEWVEKTEAIEVDELSKRGDKLLVA